MNAVIIDLETVPDTTVWTPEDKGPLLDPGKCEFCNEPCTLEEHQQRKCAKRPRGKCARSKPKSDKEEFPPAYAHRIVVLGGLLVENNIPYGLFAWPTLDQEAGLLQAFADAMAKMPGADIVTWNGIGFDLAVVQMRSLRHRISQPWYTQEYRRYGEGPRVDLANILGGSRGSDRYLSLDTAARLIGLPGKSGMDGPMVRALVEAGQLETVTNYCRRDVVQTAYLYFRYRLLRGFINADDYGKACAALKTMWEEQPGFDDFVVDESRLVG